MRNALKALLAATVVVAALAAPAAAQYGAPGGGTVETPFGRLRDGNANGVYNDEGRWTPGESRPIASGGHQPGSTVEWTLTRVGGGPGSLRAADTVMASGTVTADANGVAALALAVPTEAGTYRLTASGGGTTNTATITVAAASAPRSGSSLPRTGDDPSPLVFGGVALLGVGAALLAVTWSRRRVKSSAA